jgi:hypothetical protein
VSTVEVTVLVDDEHVGAIDDVAASLQAHGFELGEVLAETGVITGRLPDAARTAALEEVDGVTAVEVARTVRLPPPDAPTQ